MTIAVGYIIGSTARTSINRKLMTGLLDIARQSDAGQSQAFEFREIPIVGLPIYDRERDGNAPAEAETLKASIRSSDALLIVTPEYNRSIPGALKNALDWASRPYGDNALAGKPTGIMGASIATAGTAMAQQHLRNVLAYLDAPTLNQPEAFIQYTEDRFAEDGTVRDPSTRAFLATWLDAYQQWVHRVASI